jgi:hypothetical protein
MSQLRGCGAAVSRHGSGCWSVWQLVGVFDEEQKALEACELLGALTVSAVFRPTETTADP